MLAQLIASQTESNYVDVQVKKRTLVHTITFQSYICYLKLSYVFIDKIIVAILTNNSTKIHGSMTMIHGKRSGAEEFRAIDEGQEPSSIAVCSTDPPTSFRCFVLQANSPTNF